MKPICAFTPQTLNHWANPCAQSFKIKTWWIYRLSVCSVVKALLTRSGFVPALSVLRSAEGKSFCLPLLTCRLPHAVSYLTCFFSFFFQYVACFGFDRKLQCLSLANGFVQSWSDSVQLISKWDLQNRSQARQVPPSFSTRTRGNEKESYTLKISMFMLCMCPKHPATGFNPVCLEGGGIHCLELVAGFKSLTRKGVGSARADATVQICVKHPRFLHRLFLSPRALGKSVALPSQLDRGFLQSLDLQSEAPPALGASEPPTTSARCHHAFRSPGLVVPARM